MRGRGTALWGPQRRNVKLMRPPSRQGLLPRGKTGVWAVEGSTFGATTLWQLLEVEEQLSSREKTVNSKVLFDQHRKVDTCYSHDAR